MVDEAMRELVPYIESLPTQPAADLEGSAALAESLRADLPESGRPFGDLIRPLVREWARKGLNTAGPGYLAYIPGGGLFHAAVADLIANALNRYVGVWLAAPGLAQLETNVVRWFCGMVGYREGSGGVLTSGGSIANLIALVTARRTRLPERFSDGMVYLSDQAHHSIEKAALLAGFARDQLRIIPVDANLRLRVDALRESIAEDRAAGRRPFFLVGSAGTTNTGAVDDLAGLADVAAAEDLWLHVDGAYGGFFMMTDRGRRAMVGIGRADSVTLDPHKGLFLPYGTGSVIVRDAKALRRAHSVAAHYMPQMQDDPDRVDFAEISPELSRDCRGLRVWLPFAMHGAGVFRSELDEKLTLAHRAAAGIARIPALEMVAPPQLSTLAFALRPQGSDLATANARTRAVMDAVNTRHRVYLTGTMVDGRFLIRICVLSFRTHAAQIDACLEDVAEATRAVASGDER